MDRNSEPRVIDQGPNVVRLIKAMQMKGARSVEFGYFPNDYDREPGPEEIVTWWAKAEMRDHRMLTAEGKGYGEAAITGVLSELAGQMGIGIVTKEAEDGPE